MFNFSTVHQSTIHQLDCMLDNKASLSKFKSTEIIQTTLSDHNSVNNQSQERDGDTRVSWALQCKQLPWVPPNLPVYTAPSCVLRPPNAAKPPNVPGSFRLHGFPSVPNSPRLLWLPGSSGIPVSPALGGDSSRSKHVYRGAGTGERHFKKVQVLGVGGPRGTGDKD